MLQLEVKDEKLTEQHMISPIGKAAHMLQRVQEPGIHGLLHQPPIVLYIRPPKHILNTGYQHLAHVVVCSLYFSIGIPAPI